MAAAACVGLWQFVVFFIVPFIAYSRTVYLNVASYIGWKAPVVTAGVTIVVILTCSVDLLPHQVITALHGDTVHVERLVISEIFNHGKDWCASPLIDFQNILKCTHFTCRSLSQTELPQASHELKKKIYIFTLSCNFVHFQLFLSLTQGESGSFLC